MPTFFRDGKPVGAVHPARLPAQINPPPPAPIPITTCDLAVVVTCHAAYLSLLPQAIASIGRQNPQPKEKILVLDGCDAGASGWKVLKGDWHRPNPARNLGFQNCTMPWVVFWDADDLMPDGYLVAVQEGISTAARRAAILYPPLCRSDDGVSGTGKRTPFDYWSLRQWNYIGTQSAWKREAVLEVGGWDEMIPNRDDWNLAVRITAAGWNAEPISQTVVLRRHELGHRWENKRDGLEDASWRTRTLGIVTLLSGRSDCLEPWLNWIEHADLPPDSSLYVCNNCADPAYHETLVQQLARARFRNVTVLRREGCLTHLARTQIERHQKVASLYNDVLRRVKEDLVLTLEEDTLPPLDAVRKLHKLMAWFDPIGAVAAVYALPQDPAKVCGSICKDYWKSDQSLRDFPDTLQEAGFIPGGCTLFANWILRRCLPLRARQENGALIGWDSLVSLAMRQAGYKLYLHGGVRCEHRL